MTKKIFVMLALLVGLVSGANADIVPKNLSWPLDYKDVNNISLFFDHDDAVTTIGKECSNKTRYPKHLGIDIYTYVGASVYPIYDGKVKRIGYDPHWGKYIVLSHDNNTWTSVYWHLKNIKIKLNDYVSNLDIIAEVFDTSHVGDIPHLHLGIRPGKYNYAYSRLGIGSCNNLYGFVDPLKYLKHKVFKLIDDKDVYHKGNWIESTSVDFYTNQGYKVTNVTKNYAIYNFKVPEKGIYKIYERSTKDLNRDSSALFLLYIDGNFRDYIFVDQSDSYFRGKNRLIFSVNVKKNQVISVVPYKYYNDDTWLVSDAILFKKEGYNYINMAPFGAFIS